MKFNYRTNSHQQGPESELVTKVLAQGLPFKNKFEIIQELELPTGYPDILAVSYKKHSEPLANFDHFNKEHLKVLHYLYSLKASSSNEISSKLLIKPKTVDKILYDLLDAELVWSKGDRFKIKSVSKIFAIDKIIAIEAKIQDWRSAVSQAINNTWFASDSYILIPEKKNNHLIAEYAQKFGIGVIVSANEEPYIYSRAQVQKLPVSYGSWFVNMGLAKQREIKHARPQCYQRSIS